MSDNVNPASKSASEAQTVPICPHCKASGPAITTAIQGGIAMFFCASCKSILNCQLLALPRPAESRIIQPGRQN